MIQISYTKTIVGWWNIRKAGEDSFVNLSPDEFEALGLGVSERARLGCGEISAEQATRLFGAAVA
ncbi:hypothetical protein [Peribacillus asahii]|uniref:hypothetical protein n=1 Tax=Peribacillus asahii TaxID=228899 RepID=UPI002079D92E|nr:hypothetical protein [Peribacillus asahii]USK70199.1 hypothetical protein LIS76_22390 [Peribacillus asahii]